MSGSTTPTITTITTPINGGIDSLGAERIAWTGGSRAKPRTPASTKAYRPSDYESKRNCEEDCTETPDESKIENKLHQSNNQTRSNGGTSTETLQCIDLQQHIKTIPEFKVRLRLVVCAGVLQ
jgi:hypothetical protein